MLPRLLFRFGFRSDLAHDASLEDKAERLRRKAEDEKDNVITEVNDAREMEMRVRHPENDAQQGRRAKKNSLGIKAASTDLASPAKAAKCVAAPRSSQKMVGCSVKAFDPH